TQLENYESEAVSWASADSGQKFVLADDDSEESEDDSDNEDDDSARGGSGGATRDSRPSKRAKIKAPGNQLTSSTLIPTVPVSSFSLEKALGYGRNGCVFRACWEGKEVAVKQFDLGVPGVYKRAKNEIRAYEKLRDCQGILVPKALFLSRSKFGVFFLGLQQGRMPGVDDDVSNWGNVLLRLRRDYGFLHEDAEGRNGIFIQDGRGKERLVAIDLEESKFVTRQRALGGKAGLKKSLVDAAHVKIKRGEPPQGRSRGTRGLREYRKCFSTPMLTQRLQPISVILLFLLVGVVQASCLLLSAWARQGHCSAATELEKQHCESG
ncbi:MAG: hypothetical protein SGILL_007657, partial [Bacillariaceae sp.]